MQELSLNVPSHPVRIGIAAARFNQFITDELLGGATTALDQLNPGCEVSVVWVPGAYELPLAADSMLATGRFEAIIALGAVIRGGTPHFDYVAGECSRGLMDVALRHSRPVLFGVLTTDTVEQALERAGAGEGNKGHDVAVACLNMIALQQSLLSGVNDDE